MRLSIYPYSMQSYSARKIANELDIFRIRENGRYRWRPDKRVINWGNPRFPSFLQRAPEAIGAILNRPHHVAVAGDKIATFRAFQEYPGFRNKKVSPDWTTNKQVAINWLLSEPLFPEHKHAVLCRTLTRANSGRGIIIATKEEEIVDAPLYTRYTPKQQEYRVHVFQQFGVIDIQQKRKMRDEPDRNPYIRNHEEGWVFCRENVNCPENVQHLAMEAILALSLDFGAVDIGNHSEFGPCIYEVNTAPGLEGQTLTNYVKTFQKLYV